MDITDDHAVVSLAQLASLYSPPTKRLMEKELNHIGPEGRAFIAASPFVVLATGCDDGFDCSPKGDQPGFVLIEDDGKTLLIPDRPGNNRIDSLKNLVADDRIGLLFLVPGANEVFRVNGRAKISKDPRLTQRFTINGKDPKIVIVVAVEQAFQHCPKALIRSSLWKMGAGARPQGVPTLGDFAAAQSPDIDRDAFNADYERHIVKTIY
jgi:uncharacterized protein